MQRHGLSLIELLIVIAIISLLLQIALPAIEMSREAARQTHCQNNLRQLGVAAHVHLDTHNHFPSGGWTHHWVGDPARGFGKGQPGGWCYNLLPYLEEGALHDLGLGLSDAERLRMGSLMFATPVAVFTCPSRRLSRPWPFIRFDTLINVDDTAKAGRSDYAANIGNLMPSDQGALGPPSLEEADKWQDGSDRENQWVASSHNGIVYQRSEVTPAKIEDGLSKTCLFGEKFMDPAHYKTGASYGDDQSLYLGFDRDNARSGNVLHPPLQDKHVELIWLPEGDDESVTDWNFGSAHPTGYHIVLCDGSVRRIDYDIQIVVSSLLSGRNDKAVATAE
jgi:prepilin-type N-terminal cleavage/methylation domain-containing protein